MMKPLILFSYLVTLLLSVAVFLTCRRWQRTRRHQVGPVILEWRGKFHPGVLRQRIAILLLLACLVWIAFSLLREPDKNSAHFSLMLVIFLASFHPFWRVSVGDNGALLGVRRLNWNQLAQWKQVSSRLATGVELRWRSSRSSTASLTKQVPVPPGHQKQLLSFLRQKVGDREISGGN